MADFKFKVAYTEDSKKIDPALEAGTINEGDLVIVNENGVGSMKFITNEKEVIGMNAELTDEAKEQIVSETLAEADNRYLVVSETTNLILNGNTSLVPENVETVDSSDAFASAIADPTVTAIALAADVVTTAPVVVTERDLTIDLATAKIGNEVPMWNESDGQWSVFSVKNATLTLQGNGIVESLENDCYAVDIGDGGTVYIHGGTYNGNISAIYLHGVNSTCYITDGYFKIQQLNSNGVESPYGLVINILNSVRDSAKCVITGGTFEGFNPAEPEEGNVVYLPDGYTTQYDSVNNTYTVVKEG